MVSTLTAEAIELLKKGYGVKSAAEQLGVNRSTLHNELQKDPEYQKLKDERERQKQEEEQQALSRYFKGETLKSIADDMGIQPETLKGRLEKYAEFVNYKIQQDEELQKKKREAVELGKRGHNIQSIARQVELSPSAVLYELRDAGIDTSITATDNMECPACSGVMLKQELFFWKCECGAEYWPAEEQVPDDPDDWTRPWKLTFDKADMVYKEMKRMFVEEYKNAVEIAKELNEKGYTTKNGKQWKRENVLEYLKRWKLLPDYNKQRQEVEEICLQMAGKQGISCKDIADRLNREGYRTSRNKPWTMHNVRKVIRDGLGLDVRLYGTKATAAKIERENTGGKPSESHPWRVQEHAGYLAWKKAQEKRKGGDAK